MTDTAAAPAKSRRPLLIALVVALVAALALGTYLMWPGRTTYKVIGLFSTSVGIYPGDEVRVVGVPVGTIDSIEPRVGDVKITMSIDKNVKVPADAKAILVSPNLVAARFIQLTPPMEPGAAEAGAPVLEDGATIGLEDTGVPVEWDEVKEELTNLAKTLGPGEGSLQGPLAEFVDQAASTFDGNGDSFRNALRELSQTAGRLGDSSGDLFGTVRNLQTLVGALSQSNEQIVQFSGHVASVSQVLADSTTGLDTTLSTLNQALVDVRGFLDENNDTLISSVSKVTELTTLLSNQSEDLEQVLHVAPNGLANFYNIYNPAQGTLSGVLSLPNFANPVQFICGGTFDAPTTVIGDNIKRAEICKQRMGPVLRRLTMNFPPMMFHPVNSITAYKGQIIYDTPETEAKAQTPVSYLQWEAQPGVTPPVIPPGTTLGDMILPPADHPGQISPGPPFIVGSQPAPAPTGGGR